MFVNWLFDWLFGMIYIICYYLAVTRYIAWGVGYIYTIATLATRFSTLVNCLLMHLFGYLSMYHSWPVYIPLLAILPLAKRILGKLR